MLFRSLAGLGGMIALKGLSLSPDRYFLILLVPALVLGVGRGYVRDFLPLIVAILVYEQLRGLAHLANPDPYYAPHLVFDEVVLFGRNGSVLLQVVALLPLAAIPFLFGGVTAFELVMAIVYVMLVAAVSVSFGLAIASRARRSAIRSCTSRSFSRRCSSITTLRSRGPMPRLAALLCSMLVALAAGCGPRAPQFQLTDVTGAEFAREFQCLISTHRKAHQKELWQTVAFDQFARDVVPVHRQPRMIKRRRQVQRAAAIAHVAAQHVEARREGFVGHAQHVMRGLVCRIPAHRLTERGNGARHVAPDPAVLRERRAARDLDEHPEAARVDRAEAERVDRRLADHGHGEAGPAAAVVGHAREADRLAREVEIGRAHV